MRKLIVLESDEYMRNVVRAGALDALEDDETYYVTGHIEDKEAMRSRPNYLGEIDQPQERRDAYHWIRRVMLTSFRYRSRTQRIKLRQQKLKRRMLLTAVSLPGIRQSRIRRCLREIGTHPELDALIRQIEPELIIAPTAGTDTLALDAFRSAHIQGVTSLGLTYNWDNLSSKGAYPVAPSFLGVSGPQSQEHAWRIHRIPPERTRVIGIPHLDLHFHHTRGSTQSPFPFRYALFAGCYRDFEERTVLGHLDRAITKHNLDLRIVYRPHPYRLPRARPDRVEDGDLEHVIVDPQVRDTYLATFDGRRREVGETLEENADDRTKLLPSLDYYPALLEHAAFVVCPLSTMIIESAIYGRKVAVLAYHDGVHRYSPGTAINYLHYEGVEEVDGFELCRSEPDLISTFVKLAGEDGEPCEEMREQIRRWVHHDERTYGERLAEFVADIETGLVGVRGATRK